MTRSLSATLQAAIALDTTRPMYLIRMAWDTEVRVATWNSNISWNSEVWSASGAAIGGLSVSGGTLELPMGEDDPWLNLVQTEVPRDRAITIYEYHTDYSASPEETDATQVFAGFMDDAIITARGIRINLIEGKTKGGFPVTSIGPPTYNWLLTKGTRLYWEQDIVNVN